MIGRVWGTTTRLRKFLCLSTAEQGLLAEAAVALAIIRLGLWFLPLRDVRSVMASATRWARTGARADGSFPGRAGWAVAQASAYVPRASCIPQALAVQFLLERRGYPTDLRIGIARGVQRSLHGHAWLEHQGEVVFGHGFSADIVLSGPEGGCRNNE